MQFKRTEELKTGMRLARPIYNKNGVLLYERDSKLTHQGITSIRNFGLIGIYILEPAEPAPPMTKEDLEFERFQSINVFAIMEELDRIKTSGKMAKLQIIVSNIIKNYGHLDKKINFIQNLRSTEDFKYKHALNVAILCAMMSNLENLKVEERLDVVTAALLHDIKDYGLIDKMCSASPNVKRFGQQADKVEEWVEQGKRDDSVKLLTGSKILACAEIFDNMTAMSLKHPPVSEVAAVKYLLENTKFYERNVTEALIHSINLLVPGVCIELNTGEKALVLVENEKNFLRPVILSFSDNEVIDLEDKVYYGDLEIADIMKTMDNRHIMDIELLKKYGIEKPQEA